ncbi:MAG: RNA polymerase sigma factor [Saprospiraceae bacterium]
MNNQTLISGILKQDNIVYQWIYDSWYTAVKFYVKRNSGNEDDAKDLFQNTMVDLYLNIKTGKYKDVNKPLKSYFMMICQYKWLNHLRGSDKRNTVNLPTNDDLQEEDFIEAIMFKEGLLNLVEHYLDKMTDSCKTMLKAYYYDKKSLQTIANENNWSLNYAKKKNYKCRQSLKKAILDDINYKKMVR